MNNIISKLKSLIFYILCILFLANLFIYPNEIIYATKTGILLWYNNILPTLFSFIIIVNIISSSNIINYSNKLLDKVSYFILGLPFVSVISMLLGLISGYPLGAKTTVELLNNNRISEVEANKTICISNNCGPMFLIGAIGINMFSNVKFGYVLVASQTLATFTLAFLLKFYKKSSILPKCNTTTKFKKLNFSYILNNSIISAIDTILCICGIITFFCIITKLCEIYKIEDFFYIFLSNIYSNINEDLLRNLLYGFLEITNGIYLLSLTAVDKLSQLLISSFLISFGGLCTLMQTYNIISKSNISIKLYFACKLLGGTLSMCYAYILCKVFISI